MNNLFKEVLQTFMLFLRLQMNHKKKHIYVLKSMLGKMLKIRAEPGNNLHSVYTQNIICWFYDS